MTELCTSKINRQLRSLRMKCCSLNTFHLAPHKPTISVTYGSSHRHALSQAQDEDTTPPLAILQSLDRLGARLRLDRAIVENMQLSKRIYEVRDAFRNIVQCAFASAGHADQNFARAPPLTAICARLIGEHVQSEIEAALDDFEQMDGPTDDLRAQAMDDLYEQVPVAHRPRMFIAHALNYVLEVCPHHPTLLNALLEVCLSHNLHADARTVLSNFFRVATRPHTHPTYFCPLTHPAHKNFLSTLREVCSASIINDRAFTRVLIETLSDPSPSKLHAWTSKAMIRLARDLRERDLAGCFVPLCSGLAGAIAEAKPRTKSGMKAGKVPDEALGGVLGDSFERLAKWTISMLDRLHDSTSDELDQFEACVSFLEDTAQHQLHVSDGPPASPPTCLADALVCLAAYCLSSTHSASLHPHTLSALRDIPQSAHIKNSTFDGLISRIFPLPHFELFAMPLAGPEHSNTPTPPPTLPDVHGTGMEALSALAGPMRTHGLLRCEAALWLAALQHVEDLIATPTVTQSMTTPERKLSQSQLYALRLELMDRVEDAERRCFGGGRRQGTQGLSAEEGEWEWEEMVGSWVLKSPAPAKKTKYDCRASKRRRVESSDAAGPVPPRPRSESLVRQALVAARRTSSTASRGINSGEMSVSVCQPKSMQAGNQSKRRKTTSASVGSKEATSSGDENAAPPRNFSHVSISQDTPPAKRRMSNFATILADAQAHTISLCAERKAKSQSRVAPASLKTSRAFPSHTPAQSISAPPVSILTSRRQPNFSTVLADSRRNVISLREERERAAQQVLRYGQRTTAPCKRVSFHMEEDDHDGHWRDPDSSPVRGAGFVEPSSDDALNLFAYPDSSPARSR
ncbi:hypothetical protein BC628DRAFT_1359228 [Trametes gibbosa]|nr:hypothetical protein BC628DRAFT_1359228 [Trametes gibbosa]